MSTYLSLASVLCPEVLLDGCGVFTSFRLYTRKKWQIGSVIFAAVGPIYLTQQYKNPIQFLSRSSRLFQMLRFREVIILQGNAIIPWCCCQYRT